MMPARLVITSCVLLALSSPLSAQPDAERVSFYFVAHQDDWQLFMNPTAFADVTDPKTKTVFVHLTAGDNGLGTGTGGRKHPYYLARENGAETAIHFMADAGERPADRSTSVVDFNGHRLYRASYRNTVTYFLRVPDGHPSGAGFEATGFQSMERLARSEIGALSAIDGSTTYSGWPDLVATVRALIDQERGPARAIQLNVADQDARINPNDHSDHRMTAKLALEAAGGLACARRVHYVEYASAKLPENLAPQDRDLESSVLAVTAAGILALDHTSIWHKYHRSYLGRNYFRVEEGAGPCRDPASPPLSVAAPQQATAVPAGAQRQ
jgi:hypothetical protein